VLKPAGPNFRRHCEPPGRRDAPPDDRLREAIQNHEKELDCIVAGAPRNDAEREVVKSRA
jgi:hypothetical protein